MRFDCSFHSNRMERDNYDCGEALQGKRQNGRHAVENSIVQGRERCLIINLPLERLRNENTAHIIGRMKTFGRGKKGGIEE